MALFAATPAVAPAVNLVFARQYVFDHRNGSQLQRWLIDEVSFQWKNPDFLLKSPDFLIRNPNFLLKKCWFYKIYQFIGGADGLGSAGSDLH